MNNRILELADQAGRIPMLDCIDRETGDRITTFMFSEESMSKFAESIVQECVDVIMEGDRTRRDYFADKVKKHFGVE
jgi:hypothetical protein